MFAAIDGGAPIALMDAARAADEGRRHRRLDWLLPQGRAHRWAAYGRVSETDATGAQTAQVTTSFTLDTTPPPVAISLANDTGVSKTDNITKDPTLTFVTDPNVAMAVSIDGGADATVTADAPGTWPFTRTGLADGAHTSSTGATDLAGNTGTPTLNVHPGHDAAGRAGGRQRQLRRHATALTSYKLLGTAEARRDGHRLQRRRGRARNRHRGRRRHMVVDHQAGRDNQLHQRADDHRDGRGRQCRHAASAGVAAGTAADNTLPGPPVGGANLILGLGGNDVLTGGSGNDVLDGGAGIDNMSGGAGDDIYVVDNAGDTVTRRRTPAPTRCWRASRTYTLARQRREPDVHRRRQLHRDRQQARQRHHRRRPATTR